MKVSQDWLTVRGKETFRNKKDLRKIMAAQGVPSSGTVIIYCNSRQWASIDWFVLSELLANKEASLYEGLMTEWNADPAMPMEQRIILRFKHAIVHFRLLKGLCSRNGNGFFLI